MEDQREHPEQKCDCVAPKFMFAVLVLAIVIWLFIPKQYQFNGTKIHVIGISEFVTNIQRSQQNVEPRPRVVSTTSQTHQTKNTAMPIPTFDPKRPRSGKDFRAPHH